MNFNTQKCQCCGGSGYVMDHVAVGAYQRGLREKRGKSLREVAKAMEKSAPYVSDLERGRRNWSDELVADYRKALR